jgi:hypothetical protein
MPSADGRREDDSDQPFDRMATANVLIGQTTTYIGQAHRKGKLPGRITLDDEWYMGPGGKELVAFGYKPADHDQSAFQGIRALSPLILVDEACGVPKLIFMPSMPWRLTRMLVCWRLATLMIRPHIWRRSVRRVLGSM